jgi:hypothetical protein
MSMNPKTVGAFILVGTVLSACAESLPPPNDQWAAAKEDVGRAESGGARDVPNAKLHLQLAQEDLQQAKQLMGVDNKRATSVTEAARAEAQLALSLSRAASAQEAARQALTDLHTGGASGDH